jgi:hypothetical protein
MKRLPIVALIGALFLSVPLLTPGTAVGHPGNTCNPPAGHGGSGCHRVTVAKPKVTVKKPVVVKKAVVKTTTPVVQKAVPLAVVAYAPITDAELGAAFFGTQPGYGGRGDR